MAEFKLCVGDPILVLHFLSRLVDKANNPVWTKHRSWYAFRTCLPKPWHANTVKVKVQNILMELHTGPKPCIISFASTLPTPQSTKQLKTAKKSFKIGTRPKIRMPPVLGFALIILVTFIRTTKNQYFQERFATIRRFYSRFFPHGQPRYGLSLNSIVAFARDEGNSKHSKKQSVTTVRSVFPTKLPRLARALAIHSVHTTRTSPPSTKRVVSFREPKNR